MVMSQASSATKSRVADPQLRREVEAAVRRRIRGEEAEDVVQATLADVLCASGVPSEPDEFRRFVFGVARNKVFDHFRRQKRGTEGLHDDDLAAPEPPLSARDMLRWAEGELPDPEARSTLEWMLREGDGEKLEHIAEDARLPATRVRKRVSRLRKFLRERWAAELVLVGVALLLAGVVLFYLRSRGLTPNDVVEREPPRPLPSVSPLPRTEPPSRPAQSVAPPPSVAPPAPTLSATPSKALRKPQSTPTPLSTEAPRSKLAPRKSDVNSLDSFDEKPPTQVKSKAPSKLESFGEKK
jgi:RNA polymerase sigma factor (sigma-70 family)